MKKKWVLIVLIALVGFIWIQSIIPQTGSNAESLWIRNHLINPIVRAFGIERANHSLLRKIAHSFEFGILSIFVVLFWQGNVVHSFYTGFTISFLDESIQSWSGRSPEIKDIWIDLIGIGIGTLIGWVIWRRKWKNSEN